MKWDPKSKQANDQTDVEDLRDNTSILGRARNLIHNASAYGTQLKVEFDKERGARPDSAASPRTFTGSPTQQTAVKLKQNINNLRTYSARGQAIAKRVDAIRRDKKYQALTPEKQAKVREDVYNKYVTNAYQNFHLPVPDKDAWVAATGKDHPFGSKEQEKRDFNLSSSKQFGYGLNVGVDKAYSGIKMFGARVENREFMAMHGLIRHFSGMDFAPEPVKKADDYVSKFVERKLTNYADAQKARIQDDDFWIQTHPAQTTIGKLGSMSGETLATLPLYEAMGLEKVAGSAGLSLTAKLTKSPVGKWVARRLINATDGFTSSLVESGGDAKTATKDAAGFAVGGGIAEPIGKFVKWAAAPLIKKFMASVIAMGGKPLMESFIHSASHEEEQAMAHADSIGGPSTGEALEQIKRAHTIQEFMKDTRTQVVRDWYAQQQQRALEDPVNHKVHEAVKQSLGSISQQMFGKPLRGISQNQRKLVRDKALELSGEAANEAPVHLPDLLKNDVQAGIEKARKKLPIFNQLITDLEKHGVDFTSSVAENITKSVAQKTGIENKPSALAKVNKVKKEAQKEAGELITPERLVSLNAESKAYFRNPRNRTEFAAAISDTSKAGANKMIDKLKEAVPGKMRFEDPVHMLLYHYGNKKDLPEGIVKSIRYRLRQTKAFENLPASTIDLAARELHRHLYELTQTKQLRTEGNIFRSTRLGGPTSFTRWQNQLQDESVQKEVQKTMKALKQHPAAGKTFQVLVKSLNRDWVNAGTPEEYIAFREELKGIGTKMRKFARANPQVK